MRDRLEQLSEALAPLTWVQRDMARAWMTKALSEMVTEEQWQRAIAESIQAAVPRAKREPLQDRKTASTGESDK